MALPPTAKSRWNKRPPEGRPGVGGAYGPPVRRPTDPFAGVTWLRPSAMSERERDPFWHQPGRDPYEGSRVDPRLIGTVPEEGEGVAYDPEAGQPIMPDWRDATYDEAMRLIGGGESDAAAAKLASQKAALLRLGSRSLAESVLGAGDPALAGISDDPNTSVSTLAQIARQYNDLVGSVNSTRNSQGLWFSSTRANDLNRAGYERGKASTMAIQDVQDALNDLNAGYLNSMRDYAFQRMAEEQAARDRAIDQWYLTGMPRKKARPLPGDPDYDWPTPANEPWPPLQNPIGGRPVPY